MSVLVVENPYEKTIAQEIPNPNILDLATADILVWTYGQNGNGGLTIRDVETNHTVCVSTIEAKFPDVHLLLQKGWELDSINQHLLKHDLHIHIRNSPITGSMLIMLYSINHTLPREEELKPLIGGQLIHANLVSQPGLQN